jgi:hypothetical protein
VSLIKRNLKVALSSPGALSKSHQIPEIVVNVFHFNAVI